VRALPALAARWRRFAWRRPDWWVLAIAAAAWAWMIAGTLEPAHDHGGALSSLSPQSWLLMVAAMMFPLVAGQVRACASRSLWRRRQRAIGAFLLGYTALWILAGIVLSIVYQSGAAAYSARLAVVAFVVAAWWPRTSTCQAAARACHREMPLAPSGWRADRDCLRYGWAVAMSCSITCGPAMIACAFAGHHPAAMSAALVLLAIGRVDARAWRPIVLRRLAIEKALR
jgi:hypothetical protein